VSTARAVRKLLRRKSLVPEPPMPVCERMIAVKEESQKFGEFLEWLMHRYTFCNPPYPTRSGRNYRPARVDIEALLADYFKIDLVEAEKEKRRLLEFLRSKTS
jgi:hypothetical protein